MLTNEAMIWGNVLSVRGRQSGCCQEPVMDLIRRLTAVTRLTEPHPDLC